MTPSRLVRLGAAIGAACAFGAQAAPVYRLVDLGFNNSANDVNVHGAVAGSFNASRGEIWRDGAWRRKANGTFVSEVDDLDNAAGWREENVGSQAVWWPHGGGGPVDLPPPFPSFATAASAISAGGTIAGVAADSRGTHCVRWQRGVAEDLGIGGTYCEVAGVNVPGAIAGTATLRDGTRRAFLWQDGTARMLGTLGGPSWEARSINDQGHVVGMSMYWITKRRANEHAVLWKGQQTIDLGTLDGGAGHSEAYGINNADDVVGDSSGADGFVHAFLYTGGQMVALESLVENLDGWTLSHPEDINDDGVIVGTTVADGGRYRAYMLVPVTR